MSRRVTVSLEFVAGLFLFSSLPASAQEWLPELVTDTAPVECSAMSGTMLTYHDIIGKNWNRYHRSNLCLDLEAGSFDGPEHMQGLTQTIVELDGAIVMLEMLEDSEQRHKRRRVTAASIPLLSQSMADEIRGPSDLYTLYFDFPDGMATVFPEADNARAAGFAYRYPRNDLNSLSVGRWLVFFETVQSQGPDVDRVVKGYAIEGSAGILIDVTPEGIEVLGASDGKREISIDLSVSAGQVTGSVDYSYDNRLLPAARSPGEWSSAVVQVPEFTGQMVESGGEIQFVGHGVGRTTMVGDDGQTSLMGEQINVVAFSVPDGFDDALLQELTMGFF